MVCSVAEKVAVTESAALRVTLQVASPVHAPLQPEKAPLDPGVSVSVTSLFCGKVAEHVVGQLIPAGLLVTVPVPVPATVTEMVTPPGGGGGPEPATTPRQPPSTMVTRTINTADTELNQNVSRDSIDDLLLPSESQTKPYVRYPTFDESEPKRVVSRHEGIRTQ